MNNTLTSKKIHSVEEARNLAKKRMPRMMFDFVESIITLSSVFVRINYFARGLLIFFSVWNQVWRGMKE